MKPPTSTQSYTEGGVMDYIGFQALQHQPFIQGRDARVFVPVSNGGPQKVTA